MDHADHRDLISVGVTGGGPSWADLGSGRGAFTLALADLLGPTGRITSVDRDGAALAEQRGDMERLFPSAQVTYLITDFAERLDLPLLDGVVMANSLHFERDQPGVLRRLVPLLAPGGRFLLVEYDTDDGNRWVPHPISLRRWRTLAPDVGLADVREIGRRPSRFLGSIYAAMAVARAD